MLYDAIAPLLSGVQKPARYTGGEVNMVKKNPEDVRVRFAFCFPDTYEVGMSHLGMKILYHILNKRQEFYCERVFAPWMDMENAMREHGIPLYSLETFTPVHEFDIVGFTLQYEMSYTNVLNMMDLAGIPLTWKERDEANAPFVVCGGPCAFNPEPLADFVDLFMVGDGEEQILELCEHYEAWKERGGTREEFLLEMANIEGNYVPRFYEATYDENGDFAGLVRTRDDVPARIRKRCIPDLDKAEYPDSIIVPFTEIVHDRVMLEVARGCTRGCRFCQAGMLYRPQRERSLEHLTDLARKLLASTGYEEMSLSSLSTGDYSHLPELARALVEEHGCKKVAISLPSLRIDSVLGDTLEQTQSVRKTGLTFAPEAGTQRLRDVINKGVTEQQLYDSVLDAFSKGWSGVKLYFMIGLPTETYEDLDGIPHLAQRVLDAYFAVPKEHRQKGLRVGVSASSFVPKPFTPFQWEPQNSIEELQEKQRYLREKLHMRSVTFSWHEPHLSFLEAAFARGDRRLCGVLRAAHARGCKFDGWTEAFDFDAWMQAFADCGLTCAQFAQKRFALDAPLPWDHIDAGVTKAFLQREWNKALRGEVSPDCRIHCHGCGINQFCKGVCKSCE
ncbi:MAG: TIGR03960 family B12-binding radical SAM protein [Candidatus Spyradocola sp.]|jgi:radical SAM family uncharacterized protein